MTRKEHKPPVCLTIAGVDPSGGAGIIADIKTFSVFGCFATAVIASITFQNTTGVFGAEHQTAQSVRDQVQPIIDDYDIAALKTGMLPTGEVIAETARIVSENALQVAGIDGSNLEARSLELKGISEPVPVRVMRAS